MARKTIKWKFAVLFYIFFTTLTKSVPIGKRRIRSAGSDTITSTFESIPPSVLVQDYADGNGSSLDKSSRNTALRQQAITVVRPGMTVRRYGVQLNFEDGRFTGRAVLDVDVTTETRGQDLRFHANGMEITEVKIGRISEGNAAVIEHRHNGNILELTPTQEANNYIVIINYNGDLRDDDRGLFAGSGDR